MGVVKVLQFRGLARVSRKGEKKLRKQLGSHRVEGAGGGAAASTWKVEARGCEVFMAPYIDVPLHLPGEANRAEDALDVLWALQ